MGALTCEVCDVPLDEDNTVHPSVPECRPCLAVSMDAMRILTERHLEEYAEILQEMKGRPGLRVV